MSSGRRYIAGPSVPAGEPIFVQGGDWENRGVSPISVIIISLILIAIIVLLTIYFVRRINPPDVNQTSGSDLLNLDALIDLKVDGQCCLPPSASTTTKEWIYSPSNNFTFSTTKTAPSVVCQGLTGLNLSNCTNFVSDSNGNAKVVAHYGVTPYYGFAPGSAGGVCASYGSC